MHNMSGILRDWSRSIHILFVILWNRTRSMHILSGISLARTPVLRDRRPLLQAPRPLHRIPGPVLRDLSRVLAGCFPVAGLIGSDMANNLPPPSAIAPVPDAVALLHVLGQPIGWNALRLIASAGPQSVNDVAAALGCAQVSASRHLDAMWKAGAVIGVTPPDGDGRKVFYAIPPGWLRETVAGKEVDYGVCVLRFP